MFVRDALAQTEAPTVGEAPVVTDGPPPPTAEAILVEELETGGFPPLESEFFASQILWLAITFGLLYWVMSKTLVPRLAGIIENRRDRIALDLDAAHRMRADADEAQAAYEQDLAEARERSHKIAQDARDSARADADAERKRNEAELDQKLESAQGRIAEIKAKALADVDTIAEETAQAIITELTRLDVSREEVANAVKAAGAGQEKRDA
ncbi:F0F1 ATP synthase subunit B [Aureimonas populi]|uniref:ATP synthase subunit b n=1 Tax=Aureimonas populi TaxID=1701758 RepID=A0ABW5CKT9_9HYPH|nr:F0F1 ATP synthase subunit B [Aureimonas populi]